MLIHHDTFQLPDSIHSASNLVSIVAGCQVNKPVRLEIPVKDDTEIYKVVPCEENGLMIIYLSSETDETGKMIWITAFLDRSLMEKWRKSMAIPRGYILSEALYSNNHLIAFWYSSKSSETDNLRIADIGIKDSTLKETRTTIPEKSDLSHFGICSNYALLGLNTRDEKALFIRYDFNSGKLTSINQQTEDEVVIESMNIDKATGMSSMVLRTTGSARKRIYFL